MLQRSYPQPPPPGLGAPHADQLPSAPTGTGPLESPERTSHGWPAALTGLLSAYSVELATKESEQELKHRLEEARLDGEERRRQARAILWLLASTYAALLLLALFLALRGNAEQQRWALGALMTILGSILGYLVGRKA
jgi:hypothetical protein